MSAQSKLNVKGREKKKNKTKHPKQKHLFLVLQKLRLTEQRIRRIISNANKFVLADPLPDSEMDTILRDEAFQNGVLSGCENSLCGSSVIPLIAR